MREKKLFLERQTRECDEKFFAAVLSYINKCIYNKTTTTLPHPREYRHRYTDAIFFGSAFYTVITTTDT